MAYPKQLSANSYVKEGYGKVWGIVVSSTSSGTIALYDSKPNETTSGTKILDTITPSAGAVINFNGGMQFQNGLYAAVGSTIQFTLLFE